MTPLDLEIGAGTFHPITFFNAIQCKTRIFTSYIQWCKRPTDSRFYLNYYKLPQYYQYQVIMKPSVNNMQMLYLSSLQYLGLDLNSNEIRFIEDNWENPTLGAYGSGWEIRLNGMEITQFTYFQQMAGLPCIPVMGEITYGIERLALCLQGKKNIFDLIWDKNINGYITYKKFFFQCNKENSDYNLRDADISYLLKILLLYEKESVRLLKLLVPLPLVAYNYALKIVHYFNILDARNFFSDLYKQHFMLRIRKLFLKIAVVYLNKKNKY